MKNSYARVILPYEHYRERVRNLPNSPNKSNDPQLKTHINIQSAGKLNRLSAATATADEDSPPSSPLTVTSSPLSEPPDEGDVREVHGSIKADTSRPRRNTRQSSLDQATRRGPVSITNVICHLKYSVTISVIQILARLLARATCYLQFVLTPRPAEAMVLKDPPR